MINLPLLALCSLPLAAQVSVSAKPALVYSKHQIWAIEVANNGISAATVSRETIMQKFLTVSALPNDIAQDTLTSAAAANAKTWIKTAWGIASPVAMAALDGLAIANKKNGPLFISTGISGANLAVQLVGSNAPNPGKYFGELLPTGNITLPAGEGKTFGVVTVFTKGAIALGPFTLDSQKVLGYSPEKLLQRIMTAREAGERAAQ